MTGLWRTLTGKGGTAEREKRPCGCGERRNARTVSAIITTRNEDPGILAGTIQGLLRTGNGHLREVIVVDDGSDEPVVLSEPGVRVVRVPQSVGVSGARGYGAHLTSGDVLLWLDAHMSFTPGWLGLMLEQVDSGALLCPSSWNHGLTRCLSYGADFVWADRRDESKGRVPGFELRHRPTPPRPFVAEVPRVFGACYMISRASYERTGGWSPIHRGWGGMEADFSARAWICGDGVRCVTRARVGHLFRTRFPYRASLEDMEFNQLLTVKTLFRDDTSARLERYFAPVSQRLQGMLQETDWRGWRAAIQDRRRLSDRDFLHRFLPKLAE